MSELTIEQIGSRSSKWGEGPIFWQDHLYYVDIEGHALIRLDTQSGVEKIWDMDERIGTVVPCQSGDLLCAGDSGIYRFNPLDGSKISLADPEAEKRPDNRFNDGKCDPGGRFWAGTISTVKKTGDASLYRLDQSGSLKRMIPGVTNSNGICWDLEKKLMYYIDTPTQKVTVYDYDLASGKIENSRIAVDFTKFGIEGSPDGMTMDSEGMLWVAMCHGGAVLQVNPDTGELLRKVLLPCVETTACTFGGNRLDRLFVTTGIHKTLEEAGAGHVFVVDGLHAQGTPAQPYHG
ncbi:SMP-30/gluconolactonase/LRE family protein [Opitutales bacterium]|nr:SMP-30/gluconolactonase/LRE family protein [Opitutales bacterium]